MSQEVYFKPVAGVGAVVGKTKTEQKVLDEQLKERERRAKAEFVRQQYQASEQERIRQEQFGLRKNAAANVAAILGLGGIAFNAAQQQELGKLIVRSNNLNEVETKFVNGWASRTSEFGNNPDGEFKLASQMVDPLTGEKLFDDAKQAQDSFRSKALFAALYKHYKVEQHVKDATDQHLETAREVLDAVFPKQDKAVANTKINETVNPSPEVEAQTEFVKAKAALELRIDLQKGIASTAVAGGMEPEAARVLAAEVTAAFLQEQSARDRILLAMKEEQVRVQNLLKKNVEPKQVASDKAQAQRVAAGVEVSRSQTNLTPQALAALDQRRAKEAELANGGIPKGPTNFVDGVYVDPHREAKEAAAKKPIENNQVAPVNIGRFDVDSEGNAIDDGVDLAQSGAAGVEAQKISGTRQGTDARVLSGTTKSDGIVVHGGPIQRDSARVLERNDLHPNQNS